MNTTETSGFTAFGLQPQLAAALAEAKFVTPTPIQAAAIPPLLEGRDIIGIAQTGTGKTAAFALPMLQLHLLKPKRPEPRTARMIVLSPTRELAIQIADSFKLLSRQVRLTLVTMFGGVSERPQIMAAERGIDVLVATPGRLLDLVERRFLKLDRTDVFVLDEADRMLDMGFVRDVKKLVRLLPRQRQSMMFSATMPDPIREIAGEMLSNPVQVAVTPQVVTVEKIAQSVYHVAAKQKRDLLLDLLTDAAMSKVVVFGRTKHGANRVAEFLDEYGVPTVAIHGNKSQNARQAALKAFKDGHARVLVATDIVARGIDVPGITHVVNFELPNEPESYVHRIGRTARAGKEGIAVSFCDPSERSFLRQIERLTKVPLEVRVHTMATAATAAEQAPPPQGRQARGGGSPRPHGQRPQGDQSRNERFQRPAGGAPTTPYRHQPETRPKAGNLADLVRQTETRATDRPAPQQRSNASSQPHHDAVGGPRQDSGQRRNRPGSRARQRQRGAA